ncbi:MAG: hypothetical protein AAB856_03095 [Patescibacteria group bacterium]
MGKTIEYSNPLVADKAKDKSQMYGPEDSRAWIAYDSGLTRTNFGFRNVIKALGFPSLQDIRDSLSQPNRSSTGLELAGQGRIFQELDLEGVACCLAFPKYLIEPQDSQTLPIRKKSNGHQTKVALVSGDLAIASTFRQILSRFEAEKIPRPNLLLLTPAGGTNCLPREQAFIDKIIAPALALCDPESFIFLGDAPDGSEQFLGNFLDAVRADYEAQAVLGKCGDSPIFGIYKKPA